MFQEALTGRSQVLAAGDVVGAVNLARETKLGGRVDASLTLSKLREIRAGSSDSRKCTCTKQRELYPDAPNHRNGSEDACQGELSLVADQIRDAFSLSLSHAVSAWRCRSSSCRMFRRSACHAHHHHPLTLLETLYHDSLVF